MRESAYRRSLSELLRFSMDIRGLAGLIEMASPKKTHLVLSTLLAIVSEGFGVVPYGVIYWICVKLIASTLDQSDVWRLAALAMGAVIARTVCFYFSILCSHVAAFEVIYELRRKLLMHLGEVSMGYFRRKTQGSISKVLGEDVERIEIFIGHHVPDLISCVSFPLITVIFLGFVDWRLALASLVPLPVVLWIWTSTLSKMSEDESLKRFHDALEVMNGAIIEFVRGMQVIKVFNQNVRSFARFTQSVLAVKKFNVDYDTQYIFSWSLLDAALDSALLFIFPVAVWLLARESLDTPVLVLFVVLGVGFMKPLRKIVHVRSMLYRIGEGVKRIDRILREPKMTSVSTVPLLPNHTIRFEGVGFTYGGDYALSDISFEAREGTITALVGPSGAGKSTVASLIPRLWDIHTGKISMGGVDIRDIPVNVLMDQVAIVFQDTFIFSDTVHENLCMGRQASREEVVAAARAAQIHDVIVRLPQGYETLLGEGGTQLSGGESQRLAVARAILKDAPIILLDEATSFADPENEVKIKEALSRLIQGKTVMVIAHNLSTVRDADQIVMLDEGRVVGRGRHEDLLESQPLYRRMWELHEAARNWMI